MIIFLIILLIILIIGRVAAGYFAGSMPFLGALVIPLSVICAGIGVFLAIFLGIEIFNNVRGKK